MNVYTIQSNCGMIYITTDDFEGEQAWRYNRLKNFNKV